MYRRPDQNHLLRPDQAELYPPEVKPEEIEVEAFSETSFAEPVMPLKGIHGSFESGESSSSGQDQLDHTPFCVG